ncbi:uncharacterized LOC729966 homolog [Mustela nigripes]|uniref:uncharacterized LOC729966 homolog n=2 Tax=Mustela TaxID=9665 RepID=UPI0028165FBB|nr:uncharacterized LOC729966 homolog [Mustela nigripes]
MGPQSGSGGPTRAQSPPAASRVCLHLRLQVQTAGTWPHTCAEPAFSPPCPRMAASQLSPPLLLLALVLLSGNFSPLLHVKTQLTRAHRSGENYPNPHNSLNLETSSFTQPNPSPTPPNSGLASASSQPTHPSPVYPGSELTPFSHSSPPTSSTLTLPWSPTSLSPRTEPSSLPSATSDETSVTTCPAPGDSGAPELHRNPGVVVAVCLVVSVLLIGSVLMAVKCRHQGVSEF